MTVVAKKVGGPVNLLALTAVSGALVYKCGELGVKKAIKVVRVYKNEKHADSEKIGLYDITASGRSNDGVVFSVGDQFRVLESDGEAVLIEKTGDPNNPYFVSANLLRNISTYKSYRSFYGIC